MGKVSPSFKQKEAVKQIMIAKKRGESKGKALLRAGYSKHTAIKPTQVTESKGFQVAMDEAGLTDDWLNKCLADDIKSKPRNRKPELELAYRLKGKLKNDVEVGEITIKLVNYGDNDSV